MVQLFLKKALPHFIAILTFVVINMIYFYPQLDGKVISQKDTVSNLGMGREARIYYEQNGESTLWTNSMFGGMPNYQISTYHYGNKMDLLEPVFRLFFSPPIGLFNTLMIGAYLLFLFLGINPWLSIIGAIAFGLSTNNLVLWEAGHSSKLNAIAAFAPVIAGTLLTFQRKYFIGGLFFVVGMSLNMFANHQQMTYYLAMVLSIYVLIELYHFIKNKDFTSLAKIGGILTIGLILSIATSISNLYMVYEYSKDSIRGKSILTEKVDNPTSKTQEEEKLSDGDGELSTNGLDWEYVTQFSNGGLELLTGLIPGLVGGSTLEEVSESSESAKYVEVPNQKQKGLQVPLYWGKLPFTNGPSYYGAIICFLFIMGLFLVKGPIKWWILLSVLLTLVISLGKNFEPFNYLLYNVLPMYNKFRAHPSILGITALLVPFLGMLSLNEVIKIKGNKKKIFRALFIGGGITSGVCLFFALVGPYIFEFTQSDDAALAARGVPGTAVEMDRKSLMRSDSFRSLFFILASMGLIYAFLKEKIKSPLLLILGIGVLIVIDLFSVGKRYVNEKDFSRVDPRDAEIPMRTNDKTIYASEGIALGPDGLPTGDNKVGRGAYRVIDASISTFTDASTSYYHNTVGGYHAAKLRRFEDIRAAYIYGENPNPFAMLNGKYFISKTGYLTRNPGALGPVWFVEDIYKVDTPDEEFNRVGSFQPISEAIVLDKEFGNYINDFNPQKQGTIDLVAYQPNQLEYVSQSSSEQLAVFSEVWYGPNKGWQAYLDDQPVEHIRANYLLRAMRIPAGQHNIRFEFKPQLFYTSNTVSLIASLIIFALLVGFFAINAKKLFTELKLEEKAVTAMPSKTKRKVKSTKKKSKKK